MMGSQGEVLVMSSQGLPRLNDFKDVRLESERVCRWSRGGHADIQSGAGGGGSVTTAALVPVDIY